jgi:hypothetical protein
MPEAFAYSLNQVDGGWAWRVYDVEGLQVASGRAQSQGEAETAVGDVLASAPRHPEPFAREARVASARF